MKVIVGFIIIISCLICRGQTVSELHLIFGTVNLSEVVTNNKIVLKNTFTSKEDIILLIQDYNKLYKIVTIKIWYSRLLPGPYKWIGSKDINLNHDSEVVEMNYSNPGVYRVEMINNKKIKKAIAFILNN
jgi:hypothetical protein